jgi:hypothetical protein
MELTLAQSQIPFPHASALFVSLVEFACGGGLALGLLTSLLLHVDSGRSFCVWFHVLLRSQKASMNEKFS